MSLKPDSIQTEPVSAEKEHRPKRRNVLLRVCFAIFAFEIGLFLVIYPWRDTWTFNYFQGSHPILEQIWDDPFFRGALSGLGVMNIYLAVTEFVNTFRRR